MATTTPTTSAATDAPGSGTATTHVLIADSFDDSGLTALKAMGCHVVSMPDLGPDTIAAAIAEHRPHVLLVRSTKVPDEAIAKPGRLSLIIRAGAGYDNIDLTAASNRGIFVANCPGKNALAVAELAWGLIIACDRRIPDQCVDLRNGVWNKKGYAKHARGLYGRTLGIIGLGTIGHAIAERARGFGMTVAAWSRSQTPESAKAHGYTYCASPLDVARSADVVSVSVASTPETKHLINAAFLAEMKDGAIFINTSRGAVVDESALAEAVRTRSIRAGLDVWEDQPSPNDTAFARPIVGEAGVYGTHHCGASTDQSQEAIAAEAVRIVSVYVSSGEVPNCVNRQVTTSATSLLTVRHLNRPGVLAHVFQVLSASGLNIEEMENMIYDGATAACARIQIDGTPDAAAVDAIADNPHILSVDLT